MEFGQRRASAQQKIVPQKRFLATGIQERVPQRKKRVMLGVQVAIWAREYKFLAIVESGATIDLK